MSEAEDAVEKALLLAAVEQIKADNRRSDQLTAAELAAMEARFEHYVEHKVFEAWQVNLDQRLKPLETILKGLVGLILLGVAGAILDIVVNTPVPIP